MTLLQSFLFFLVSLSASVVGAICGIGGGVIVKPVLDSFGWTSVSAISFFSNCMVLSMSCYSVFRSMSDRSTPSQFGGSTPLAIGAAAGGVLGKQLFSRIQAMFDNANTVGAVQAGSLLVITVGTMLYMIFKDRIRTRNVQSGWARVLIGLALGVFSSFLGIGGGPINLVVLDYFFSMKTKVAAANSLYVILFSQAAAVLVTLVTRTVPAFDWITLIFMVAGGIFGGMIGRKVNKKISGAAVSRLLIGLMGVIICICAFNVYKYLG